MKWVSYVGALTAITPVVSHASVYLTVEQAQQLMFPHTSMQKVAVTLTDDQIKSLKKSSGIFAAFKADQVYKVAGGGWFIVDQVLGKHEMITYAVALNANGSVKQVEILEYNESYGGQVRNVSWRQQFVGKTVSTPVQLNNDIKNISGATLSCKHLTDGVRRVLQFHQMVLKSLA